MRLVPATHPARRENAQGQARRPLLRRRVRTEAEGEAVSVYDLAAILGVLFACYGFAAFVAEIAMWVLGKLSRRRKP